jgi:hypothetical protein
MVHDMPDANRITQFAPGFRAASKSIKGSRKDSARSCNTREEFPLFPSHLPFLYRDRARIGPGHPAWIYFHHLQLGGDPRGVAGFRLPTPSTGCGMPTGTPALYALTACA